MSDQNKEKKSHLNHAIEKLGSMDEDTIKKIEEIKSVEHPEDNKNIFIFNDWSKETDRS